MAVCTVSSSSFSSSSAFSEELKISSELSDELYGALNTDRQRFQREFFSPGLTAEKCNYYPRYPVIGSSESGSAHVIYLGRSYFRYDVPSNMDSQNTSM